MSSVLRMIAKDKEIQAIKKEWLENNLGEWLPFNFDNYNSFEGYKNAVKKEFERLKKLKSEQ